MKPPDYLGYLYFTGIAFAGHVAAFMALQPQPDANTPPRPFPWRRLLASLPVCFVMGLAGALFGTWLGIKLGFSTDNIALARDGLCAVFGYGGTAVVNAVVQAVIDRIKLIGGGLKP